MIINNKLNINQYNPRVKTEETILKLLVQDKDLISDEYELMLYPLAHISTYKNKETDK